MTDDKFMVRLDVELLLGWISLDGELAFCLAIRRRTGSRWWTRARMGRGCIETMALLSREME